MNKIIRISLASVLLAAMLLCTVSCELETASAYTVLRDHINASIGDNKTLDIPDADALVDTSLYIKQVEGEDEDDKITLVAKVIGQSEAILLEADFSKDNTSTVDVTFLGINSSGQMLGQGTLDITQMTGEDLITFDTTTGMLPTYEYSYRIIATELLNSALLALDKYSQENVQLSLEDYGFTSLSEKHRYTNTEAETEEDLGGAFSPARLKLAGTMILTGMGMIFLVLSILWVVLIIFKKVMYDGPNKKKPKAERTADPVILSDPAASTASVATLDDETVAAIVGAMAYGEDDATIVAAITAAIAETIASDEQLSREFANGFRVVSLKRKSGKSAWNK